MFQLILQKLIFGFTNQRNTRMQQDIFFSENENLCASHDQAQNAWAKLLHEKIQVRRSVHFTWTVPKKAGLYSRDFYLNPIQQ